MVSIRLMGFILYSAYRIHSCSLQMGRDKEDNKNHTESSDRALSTVTVVLYFLPVFLFLSIYVEMTLFLKRFLLMYLRERKKTW